MASSNEQDFHQHYNPHTALRHSSKAFVAQTAYPTRSIKMTQYQTIPNPIHSQTITKISGIDVPGITTPNNDSAFAAPAFTQSNPGVSATQVEVWSNKLNTLALHDLPGLDTIAKTLEALDDTEKQIQAIQSKCSWARLYPDPRTFDKAALIAHVQKLRSVITPLPKIAKAFVPAVKAYITALDSILCETRAPHEKALKKGKPMALGDGYFPANCTIATLCYLTADRLQTTANEILHKLKNHVVLVQWRTHGMKGLERQVDGLVDMETCHESTTVQRYFPSVIHAQATMMLGYETGDAAEEADGDAEGDMVEGDVEEGAEGDVVKGEVEDTAGGENL